MPVAFTGLEHRDENRVMETWDLCAAVSRERRRKGGRSSAKSSTTSEELEENIMMNKQPILNWDNRILLPYPLFFAVGL